MKTFFKNICITVFLSFLHISSFAHFGSKGPFGGSVSCSIVFDSTVYLGTFTGGVFESTSSKLVAWRARPVGLKSGKIIALAHTGKYVFAATADSGIFRFTGISGTDRYWEKVNTGLGNVKITSLVALDSITLMAGTDGNGIFKTTDKGATWIAVNNFDLHHFNISGLAKAGDRIVHTSDGGLYASDDKGASWIDFNDEATDDLEASAISYNSVTDEVLVANQNGLYITTTASTVTSPIYASAGNGLPTEYEVRSISNNGTAWFLSTDKGLFVSLATDISWTSINTGIPTTDLTTIVPFRNNLVAGTNKEGIFKASNVGSPAWVSTNSGFNNLATYAVTTAGEKIIVTATEKGVFVSRDIATSYVRANNGLTDSLNVTDLLFAETYLYATTQNAGVFISPDTGKTWQDITGGSLSSNNKQLYYSNGSVYCIGEDGIVCQANLNNSKWGLIYSYAHKASSIIVVGSKTYISTSGGGVWSTISTNGSNLENTGLSNLDATSIAYSNGKLFVGTAGSGVFVSDTASINWTPTADLTIKDNFPFTEKMGLDGRYVQAMGSNAGYVFASYRGALLATSDNGATWIAGGTQFNLPSYADVNKISFTTTRVFVTTPNNNIYSNGLSELPKLTTGLFDAFIAKNNLGIRVSPNPSNGSFALQIDGKVENVEMVNFAGQTVAQLSSISNQTVNLEVTKGIYLVRAKTANGVLVQKVIVE